MCACACACYVYVWFYMFTDETEIEIAYVYARKTRNTWPDGDFDDGDDYFPKAKNRFYEKMQVSLEKRYI